MTASNTPSDVLIALIIVISVLAIVGVLVDLRRR